MISEFFSSCGAQRGRTFCIAMYESTLELETLCDILRIRTTCGIELNKARRFLLGRRLFLYTTFQFKWHHHHHKSVFRPSLRSKCVSSVGVGALSLKPQPRLPFPSFSRLRNGGAAARTRAEIKFAHKCRKLHLTAVSNTTSSPFASRGSSFLSLRAQRLLPCSYQRVRSFYLCRLLTSAPGLTFPFVHT